MSGAAVSDPVRRVVKTSWQGGLQVRVVEERRAGVVGAALLELDVFRAGARAYHERWSLVPDAMLDGYAELLLYKGIGWCEGAHAPRAGWRWRVRGWWQRRLRAPGAVAA